MFIGVCAQINICENLFFRVSAFVIKISYFIEQFYRKFVLNKYMRGYIMAMFKLLQNILSVSCGFCAILL